MMIKLFHQVCKDLMQLQKHLNKQGQMQSKRTRKED